MRAAIYARYSSDLQRDASIEDQVRVCRARADREGWEVGQTFTDSAATGATMLRAGYQAMLTALRSGTFDVVLAESLDRFSRDLEHTASFHKQCVFYGVRIHTLAEGDVSELHIGLKGTMGALYLKELAEKTRRGLEGRIHVGRCTGTPPFGYTVVRRLTVDGELDRGLREIDPVRAAIVRRVFELYAGGASPRRIAKTLNAEGIPGPGGGKWSGASLLGRAKRGDGLLRNELYVGRLVWRRRVNTKDPMSGARLRRNGRPEDLVVKPLPALRIVEDALWDRVQSRIKEEAATPRFGGQGGQHAFWDRRRPKHLLTGKVVCGVCGRLFKLTGQDYLRCRAATDGACTNTRTVRMGVLEGQVLELLQRQLMRPDALAEFVTTFNAEWERVAAEAKAAAHGRQRDQAALDRKIANLVDAISDGRSSPAILARLHHLEAQRSEPAAAVADPGPKPSFNASFSDIYARRIAELTEAVRQGTDPADLELARALIDQVIVHPPSTDGDPPGVELIGNLLELLRASGLDESDRLGATGPISPVLDSFVRSVKVDPGAEPLALPNRPR